MIPVMGGRRREQAAFNPNIVMATARVERNPTLQFPYPHKLSHSPVHRLKVYYRFDKNSLLDKVVVIKIFFTDIREVLKDLQMLSASLLGMETSQVTTDSQNKT